MSVAKCMTVTAVLMFLSVIGFAFMNMYLYVNPMHGIDTSSVDQSKSIRSLWNDKQNFSLYCFLSTKQSHRSFNFTRNNINYDDLLIQQHDLQFDTSIQSTDINTFNVNITSDSTIWLELKKNTTNAYLHVVIVKDGMSINAIDYTHRKKGDVLYDVVSLVKHDRIPRYYKERYLLSDFGIGDGLSDGEKIRMNMPSDAVISYWKPEVSVKLLNDRTEYPHTLFPQQLDKHTVAVGKRYYYIPPIHVDEVGLTSDKYIPLNSTMQSDTVLPLKVTYGSMSLQRWLFMQQMQDSLNQQKSVGFSDKDIDDVRRLISDTSLYYLLLTIIASLLHLIFEFLAFQSDIRFWATSTTFVGISLRTVIVDLVSQAVVFLYLVDSETSYLILVPTFFAIMIQIWKARKVLPLIFASSSSSSSSSDDSSVSTMKAVTLEADSFAFQRVLKYLAPVIVGYIVKSLVYDKHFGWYSFLIAALTGCVYTFGFISLFPQLYINHRLQSVSQLPWNYLMYKFLNTFIDDIFAFIIKMPAMHRISCFRDDIVFIVYLYQRYTYKVDVDRPVEK